MCERSEWERHPNFRGPAAIHLQVHDRFRRALDALVRPTDNGQRHLFRRLRSVFRHHHHAEEVGLFPMIRAQTGGRLDELIHDHEQLDATLARVADGFARGEPDEALHDLRHLLLEHFEREEQLVIPRLLELGPGLRRG